MEYNDYNRHEVTISGHEAFYRNDKFHRLDGPAVIYPEGSLFWFFEGKLHREGGPAVIIANGERSQRWYVHGQCHREDGPAYTDRYGTQLFYLYNMQVGEHVVRDPEARKSWLESKPWEWWNQMTRRNDGPKPVDCPPKIS
jgi:hypothetical protein